MAGEEAAISDQHPSQSLAPGRGAGGGEAPLPGAESWASPNVPASVLSSLPPPSLPLRNPCDSRMAPSSPAELGGGGAQLGQEGVPPAPHPPQTHRGASPRCALAACLALPRERESPRAPAPAATAGPRLAGSASEVDLESLFRCLAPRGTFSCSSPGAGSRARLQEGGGTGVCAAEGGVAVERGSEVSSPHTGRAVPGLESCGWMDSQTPRKGVEPERVELLRAIC